MKITKTIITLSAVSLVVASSASAQDQGRPGMMQERMEDRRENRQEFREERREDIKEMRGEIMETKKEFRQGMQDLKDWRQSSTTATGTRPTPFKDLKNNLKEERKEYMNDRREDRREYREEMGVRPRPLNATATAAIAAKLGITTDALQAQLASGTKLKELVKDKISPEEMKNILPPKVATFTRAIEEKGFFNNFRAKIFGTRQEVVIETENEFGEVTETPTGEQAPRPFWKRFFGF